MTDSKPKTKALIVATRCQTVEQFVATFYRFCDETTFFVATLSTRPVGLETAFSIQLEDKTPVLRGLCEVVEVWSTPANRFGRPGVRLAVKRLTTESHVVFKQLQTARKTAEAADAAAAAAGKTIPPLSRAATWTTPAPAPPPAVVVPPLSAAPVPSAVPAARPGASTPSSPTPFAPLPALTPPALPPLPGAPKPPPIPSVRATPPPMPVIVVPPVVAAVAPPPPPVAAPVAEAAAAEPAATEPAATEPMPTIADPVGASPEAAAAAAAAAVSAAAEAPEVPEAPAPYVPEPIAASDDLTNPVASETRTPGSTFILPANPLMNLTDSSLEGFVDCALYEETGNFFRAPEYEDSAVELDDPAAPPPPARPGPRTLAPVPALRPTAFVPETPRDEEFIPDPTPLAALVGITPARARAATPLPIPPTPPGGRAPTPPVYDDSQGMFAQYTAPSPGPVTPPAAGPVVLDNTAALIALNRKRDHKRWLVIGGVASGVSLLLLVIVVASSGGGKPSPGGAPAPAPTPPTPAPAAEPAHPAVVTPAPVTPSPDPTKVTKVTPAKPATPEPDPGEEPDSTAPTGDPNAPPVTGSGPCRVIVNSSPAGSIVSVDDQAYGPSPIAIDGPCARRKIDVKHPRYALGTKWVTLTAGKPSTVDLALARPTHTVTVLSNPSGATVSIAGRPAGTTPTQVKVMGFSGVTITVEKRGFKTETKKLYSKIDGEKISVKLVRPDPVRRK